MNTVQADDLAATVSPIRLLLLDFDGPICDIFAGYPAPRIAQELRDLIAAQGHTIAPALAHEQDPLLPSSSPRWTRPALTGFGTRSERSRGLLAGSQVCRPRLRFTLGAEKHYRLALEWFSCADELRPADRGTRLGQAPGIPGTWARCCS